ncbi:unnamed protein product [Caenorhabditis brenneri]
MTSNSGIVKLNIGGSIFHTTKSTLTKFDGFFKTILETDVPITKDESGAIFIDRDPTHFRLILNFMRDGDVKLSSCEMKVEEILKEAQYYLLSGLIEVCSIELLGSFKFIKSGEEEIQKVLSSDKPVVLISTGPDLVHLYTAAPPGNWKKFVVENSDKWNIYFTYSGERFFWNLYSDESWFPRCEKYECCCRKTKLEHLQFHMDEYLLRQTVTEI